MPSTQVNIGPIETFKFFNDKQQIRLPGGAAYIELTSNHASIGATINPEDKVLSLLSSNKKLVSTIHISFYHFCMDFVGRTVDELIKDPDIELIIHNPMLANENIPGTYVFDSFFRILNAKGIKCQVVNLNSYDVLEIDNVYLLHNPLPAIDHASTVFSFFADTIKRPGIAPHRDIFLSRRHMGNRNFPNAPDWAWAKNDNRIDSHEAIEEYFRSLGYEILIPESLGSLEEQINTFYETRTLVSTTSSGLSNSIFMQPGQTVIELATPLIIHVSDNNSPDENKPEQWRIQEELHHFYSMIAFHKQHKFLLLGNKYRKSGEVIKQIEEDSFLKSFINRA